MANWLRNTSCPNCGSKDNLGVYDDASTWCWGCRHYTPPTTEMRLKSMHKRKATQRGYTSVTLPEDATKYLPEHAKRWLAKYDLTNEEISGCQVLYSFEKDLLIFPIYSGDGTLLMWQGRYFGDNEKHPKYLTYGAKDVLHILGPDTDTIVVVEDLVSAVKVARVTTVTPLWGSSIGLELATRLSKRFKHLVLWLDMDKASESLKMAYKHSVIFQSTRSVVTPLDPKEYSDGEIRGFLGI